MEIQEIKKKALVLDKDEIKKMKACFAYLYHRKMQHPESWVAENSAVEDFIDYMRGALGEMESDA